MSQSDVPTYHFMNGWDLIAGTKQKKVNELLKRIPDVHVTGTLKVPFFGTELDTTYDVTFRAPSILVKEKSGRQIDVTFPVSGKVIFGGFQTIELQTKEKPTSPLIATVQLTQIEAELQDKQEEKKTKYDLILDLKSKDLIVDFKYEGFNAAELTAMILTLKKTLQEKVSEKHKYHVVSFYLNNDISNQFKSFIPHLADFSFVKDDKNVENSNILVLMLTVTKKKGNIFFNAPILPENEDYIMMVNNHLLLQSLIYPKLIDKLLEKVENKNENDLKNSIIISSNDATKELWTIHNNRNIDLDMSHDPWISKFECKIDESAQQLCLYLDAKADVSFLSIGVDTWVRTWLKLKNDAGKLSIEKANEQQGKSTSIDLVLTILSFLGGIAYLITNLIRDLFHSNIPDLGGEFDSITKFTVTWPFQKYVAIKEVLTPGHVVFTLDVNV